MANITTIKPVKGSGKFVDAGAARVFNVKRDSSGREIRTGGKQFNKEKFPMSRQMLRPAYSRSQRRWLIDMEEEELNELVKECRFRYPSNHRNAGQEIEKAYVHDPADPFFSHKNLKIISQEGEVALRDTDPVHKVLLACFKAHPEFQFGSSRGRSMLSSRTKYVISDKSIETEAKKSEMEEHDKALELYKGLTYADKKKVARIMNLPVDDNIEPVDLDLLLRSRIDSKEKSRGQLFRTAFIQACELPAEDLNMRDMVQRARKLSILRKKEQGYEFMGQFLGKRVDTVERYFADPDNQEMFIRLETALKEAESNRPH